MVIFFINKSTQSPTTAAYVTYSRDEDALAALASLNNSVMDGRTLRASLGTTKYCSSFLKNAACVKTVGNIWKT